MTITYNCSSWLVRPDSDPVPIRAFAREVGSAGYRKNREQFHDVLSVCGRMLGNKWPGNWFYNQSGTGRPSTLCTGGPDMGGGLYAVAFLPIVQSVVAASKNKEFVGAHTSY